VETTFSGPITILVDRDVRLPTQAGIAVNPGPHEVVLQSDGTTVVSKNVDVSAGERVVLHLTPAREIEIEVPPKQSTPRATPRDTHKSEIRTPTSRGVPPLWFYVTAGTSVALAGVATWSALDTQAAFDDYEKDFPRLNQMQVNDRVEEGHARELRTNIAFGLAAATAVGSAALGVFFVDWNGDAEVAVLPNTDGVSVSGRF
jgi:hypothetical protein